jgi:SAM-dependent methyltransferase|tara:strand:+ start:1295 stop:1996 length:702 start_codon:yes stop_codon:yes gene_type:complete
VIIKKILPKTFIFFLSKIKNFLKKKLSYLKIYKHPIHPISDYFGFDRGLPIDRYYINKFININKKHIRGNVLEIGDDRYSKKFKCDSTIYGIIKNEKVEILNLEEKLPNKIKKFDCIICTQVINYTYKKEKFISNLYKLLKKNGILLLTCSSITRISNYDYNRYGDYWRFTDMSLRKLLSSVFNKKSIRIKTHGNISVSTKFLYGLSADEVSYDDLNFNDKNFSLLISCRAKK